jgi:hypothetical protein
MQLALPVAAMEIPLKICIDLFAEYGAFPADDGRSFAI